MKQVNLLFKTVLLIGLSWMLMFGIVYSQKLNQARNWCAPTGNHFKFNPDNTLSVDSVRMSDFGGGQTITTLAMSDSTGRLLYYLTNNDVLQYYNLDVWYSYAFVCNSEQKLMENGDSLLCNANVFNGLLSFPVPGKEGLYYLFTLCQSLGKKVIITNPFLPKMYYHIIDMRENNGLGKVIKKNILVSDTTTPLMVAIAAIKHSDGVRYWILTHGEQSDVFYKWLVGPDGIDTIPPQVISGSPIGIDQPWPNIGKISTNLQGDKIAVVCSADLYTFDFDRCTGQISNGVNHRRTGSALKMGGGDFSPNSKYYYYPKSTSAICQLDIEDPTQRIEGIASSDLFMDYSMLVLGPDGKMYIGSYGQVADKRIGVIDNPNEKGSKCNFRKEGISVPKEALGGLPYFPNFDLGPEPPKIEYDTFRVCRKKQKIYSNVQTMDTLNYRAEWVPNIGLTDNTVFSPGIWREKDTITYTLRIFSRDFDCEKINRRVKVMFLRPSSEECSNTYVDPVVQVAPMIKIYPNPVKDLLTIVSNKIITKIRIFDLNGKQLATREPGDKGLEYELHVQDFPRGIYLLQVETDGGSATQRVVVE